MSTNFPNGLRSRGVPLPSGMMPPTGGNVFHVDSGHTNASDSGPGTNPNHPMATLDAAIALCTANNGDQIWVYPGHAEAVIAAAGLDLDVAGITIIFLGNGNDRGTITFSTAVGADMDVDAADITLINPRFVAGIDALTGPIDVNAARFRMYGATWHDGTGFNTTDCVVADANADNMVIEDIEFVDGDGAGTQKQSFIQVAGATGVIIRRPKVTGDFGTGIIENGTAWIDALLEDLSLDNAAAGPVVCLLLQATSTGWVRNSSRRVASGTTGYTANNDMQFDNVKVVGTDAISAGDGLIGQLADAAATGAVTTTDTLVAYVKQLITMLGPTELDADTLGEILVGTAGISAFPAAAIPANAVSLAEVIRQLYAALEGTAADQNGVATWPAEAAPANNVSLAEAIRAIYNQTSHSGAASVVTRQAGWGNIVSKTEDLNPVTDDLFTVTGKVLITLLTGEVTQAIGAAVNDYLLRVKTSNEAIAAATDISSDAIGTMYLVSGHPDDILNGRLTPTTRVAALSGNNDGGINDYVQAHSPMIVGLAGGSLIIQSLHTAGDAGDAVIWTLMYIPLEASASVAATA